MIFLLVTNIPIELIKIGVDPHVSLTVFRKANNFDHLYAELEHFLRYGKNIWNNLIVFWVLEFVLDAEV